LLHKERTTFALFAHTKWLRSLSPFILFVLAPFDLLGLLLAAVERDRAAAVLVDECSRGGAPVAADAATVGGTFGDFGGRAPSANLFVLRFGDTPGGAEGQHDAHDMQECGSAGAQAHRSHVLHHKAEDALVATLGIHKRTAFTPSW